MAGVKSIQTVNIELAKDQLTNSATLSGLTDIANCVPFSTTMNIDRAQWRQDWEEQAIDVHFTTSPDTVHATTVTATRRVMSIQITVVEFDPDDVNVYQGAWQLDDGLLTDVVSIGGTVVVANTFMIQHWMGGVLGNQDSDARGRITSTTQLTFDRVSWDGDLPGHFYVVESKSGADFTVQSADISLTGTSADATLTAVDMSKTFMIGTYYCDGTRYDNNKVGYLQLYSTTVARAIRADATDSNEFSIFAVEFDSGGAEDIQRGVRYQTTALTPDDLDITAVDTSVAMAWTPAEIGHRNAGLPGDAYQDQPDAMYLLTFLDSDTIRFEHWTGGGEADNYIAWEVIEWELSGAPPAVRRVMVIS